MFTAFFIYTDLEGSLDIIETTWDAARKHADELANDYHVPTVVIIPFVDEITGQQWHDETFNAE